MKTIYNPILKAHLTLDNRRKIRHILHTQKYFLSDQRNARLATTDYLHKMSKEFQIPTEQLKNLYVKTSFLDPREQGVEYRFYEIKKLFSSATYCYYQTVHNVPVWQAGMTVTVKENPYRITHADHYGHDDIKVQLPSGRIVESIRRALIDLNSAASIKKYVGEKGAPKAIVLSKLFPISKHKGTTKKGAEEAKGHDWTDQAVVTRGLFYIYKFNAEDRQPQQAVDFRNIEKAKRHELESDDAELSLPLPPVPAQIKDGQYRLVAELIFHLPSKEILKWKALLDVETGSILWLRAMVAGVNGLVFTYDPMTSTGDTSNTPDDDNTVLNPLRDDVELLNLDPPVDGMQSLTGTHVTVSDDDTPIIPPPTEAVGTDFDYDARTNNFAAVNAYYHGNNLFDVIEDLGFDLDMYFDGTDFPVHLDHRASYGDEPDGIERNAACFGDGPTGFTGGRHWPCGLYAF